jgi:F0F1-type ATP synthase assembly protein I
MRGFSAAYGLLVSILVGLGLGFGVDHLTHHAPFGMLAGIFLGFAAGLYSMYKAMMADADDASRSSDADNHGPPDPK